MIFKCLLIISLSYSYLISSSIDKKIKYNKNVLKKQSIYQKQANKEIKKLALEIQTEEKKYTTIQNKINAVSNNISINKKNLKKAINDIKLLENQSVNLKASTKVTEKKIVDSIIENYSISLGKSLINKESLDDIINKERFDIVFDSSKDKILKSNLTYFKLQNDKRKNNVKSKELLLFISKQEKEKVVFKDLKNKLALSLKKLKNKKAKYKKKLEQIVSKQNQLSDLLGNLKILKVKESQKLKLKRLKEKLARQEKLKKIALQKKKAALRRKIKKSKQIKIAKNNSKKIKKENKKYTKIRIDKTTKTKEIDLKVRNIGSSVKGIKTTRYWGAKTIAPLKSYKITKKFGKYFDPVYKIELFNESISMKSKHRNAKVHSVLRGKIVYAKNNAGTLGNVVIVKHRNSLHTVYSQLSNIPRSLKVGKWVPKGYVIGRVNDTLVFQATKNNRYINPIKLFK